MEVEDVPFSVSLPLLGVGAFTLLLSFCFCCYLWKLKRNALQDQQGYVMKKYTSSNRNQQNDTCPVCLDEFKSGEKLAICQCKHGFHSRCLLLWLEQRNTCPMCKAPVRGAARETTGLVRQTSSV
ncbi:hypothetical protein BsWGS_02070 [Bradybaena similaris]